MLNAPYEERFGVIDKQGIGNTVIARVIICNERFRRPKRFAVVLMQLRNYQKF
jgi:hypothetical protein